MSCIRNTDWDGLEDVLRATQCLKRNNGLHEKRATSTAWNLL